MLDKICTYYPYHIGIIGGGELGKMMTIAAKQLGFNVIILDPTPDCPAAQVADKQIIASFTDRESITSLAKSSQVVTYEFEYIDSQTLIDLVQAGHKIYPNPSTLQVIQNKLFQKEALVKGGIPVTFFSPVKDRGDILALAKNWSYPLILKSCIGGYDGRGSYVIKGPSDIDKALEMFKGIELMVETFVPFVCEVSMIVVRSKSDGVRIYPLAENKHVDNILQHSITPARVSDSVVQRAREIAAQTIEVFQGIGVFCIEMFVTLEGNILVNQVVPRPHNSGHYTIEACVTSQFEQHIRAICDLPLGDTRLLNPAIMVNLLGTPGEQGRAVVEGCATALKIPGVNLHIYGKKETWPNRKMGHVTIIAPALKEAMFYGKQVARILKVRALKEGER